MHVFSKQVSDKRDLHCTRCTPQKTDNATKSQNFLFYIYKNKLTSIYQTSKLFRITQIIEIILHVSKLLHLEE